MIKPTVALRLVKVAHTLAWAFFAGCILIIPVVAWRGEFVRVIVLTGFVLFEVGILIVNRWQCPLTRVAALFTDDRRDNFDIYLPLWVARYNKLIFGWLFAVALLFTLARWQRWL